MQASVIQYQRDSAHDLKDVETKSSVTGQIHLNRSTGSQSNFLNGIYDHKMSNL